MEGHRADGLWTDLGKDSLPPPREGQPHILELSGNLGIVSFSRIPRTGKVSVGVQGGAVHPCEARSSVQCQAGLTGRTPGFDSLSVCCVTLGKPLPVSECQSVQ